MSAPSPTFTLRHVQMVRAAIAAIAAVMITFTPEHSAAVGLSVFSGFALTTGLVLILAAWLVGTTGTRWPYVLLGIVYFAAGMTTGVPPLRSDTLFFVVLIAFGILAGLAELLPSLRNRGQRGSRDGILVGSLSLLLAAVLIAVSFTNSYEYSIPGAGTFTLSGILLGVGVFGGYVAVVAVFLGIAGVTPSRFDHGEAARGPSQENAVAG